jgi:hypothetical protein
MPSQMFMFFDPASPCANEHYNWREGITAAWSFHSPICDVIVGILVIHIQNIFDTGPLSVVRHETHYFLRIEPTSVHASTPKPRQIAVLGHSMDVPCANELFG